MLWNLLKQCHCFTLMLLLFSEAIESSFHLCDTSEAWCDSIENSWKIVYTNEENVTYVMIVNGTVVKKSDLSYKHSQAQGIALDTKNNLVYWTDSLEGSSEVSIYRISVDAKNDNPNKELVGKHVHASALAFDWITQNVYYVSTNYKTIGVCNPNIQGCTELVDLLDFGSPIDIALHPNMGLMFWTMRIEAKDHPYAIYQGGMDGSQPTSIFIAIENPVSITVDGENDRIYWIDEKTYGPEIGSCALDGSNPAAAHTPAPHAMLKGISVVDTRIFWMSSTSRTIHSADKIYGDKPQADLNLSEFAARIREFALVHIPSQSTRALNPCERAKCSHICTLGRNASFQCFCPSEMMLDISNNKTCIYDGPKLLIGRGSQLKILRYFNTEQNEYEFDSIVLPETSSIDALIYNAISHSVIFAQGDPSKIFEYGLYSRKLKCLIDNGLGKVGGFDLDYVRKNLYWVNPEKGTLEVMSLHTRAKTVVANLNAPTSLSIVLNVLYVAITENQKKVIVKMNMDGSNRVPFFSMPSNDPVSVSYDHKMNRIFIVQNSMKKIYSTDLNGSPLTPYPLNYLPRQVQNLDNDIFWTDESSCLNVFNLYTELSLRIEIDWSQSTQNFSYSVTSFQPKIAVVNHDIKVLTDLEKTHECNFMNATKRPCSHICLQDGNSHGIICKCPEGMILFADGKTCMPWDCTKDYCKSLNSLEYPGCSIKDQESLEYKQEDESNSILRRTIMLLGGEISLISGVILGICFVVVVVGCTILILQYRSSRKLESIIELLPYR